MVHITSTLAVKTFPRLFQARRLVRLLPTHSTDPGKKAPDSPYDHEICTDKKGQVATITAKDRKRPNGQDGRISSLIRTIKSNDAGYSVAYEKGTSLATVMATQNFLFKQHYGSVLKKKHTLEQLKSPLTNHSAMNFRPIDELKERDVMLQSFRRIETGYKEIPDEGFAQISSPEVGKRKRSAKTVLITIKKKCI